LGGLEPPTSCSTDRRSNQLSYNCILTQGPPKRGVANGPETRCNASLWQGRGVTDYVVRGAFCVHLLEASVPPLTQQKARACPPGLFVINSENGQAAGL
jgi:hypothetical protein